VVAEHGQARSPGSQRIKELSAKAACNLTGICLVFQITGAYEDVVIEAEQ
jgi:hypothetical protein